MCFGMGEQYLSLSRFLFLCSSAPLDLTLPQSQAPLPELSVKMVLLRLVHPPSPTVLYQLPFPLGCWDRHGGLTSVHLLCWTCCLTCVTSWHELEYLSSSHFMCTVIQGTPPPLCRHSRLQQCSQYISYEPELQHSDHFHLPLHPTAGTGDVASLFSGTWSYCHCSKEQTHPESWWESESYITYFSMIAQ